MTKPARSSRASARVIPLRKGTTLEMVRLACPDSAQAQRISESFGLAILDSDGIRDLHERLIIETADALKDGRSTLDDARMLDDLGRRRRRRAGRRASVSRRADDAARSIRAKKLDNRVCDTVR